MIKVTCGLTDYSMTVEGHAIPGKRGEDLICSAATILAITLVNAVDARSETRKLELRDGYAHVQADENSVEALDVIRTGFKCLESKYPEYVTVKDVFPQKN